MTIGAAIDQPVPGRRLGLVRAPEATSSDTLKSVSTALDVLDCFAFDTELGVSDIARRLGVAKSTAHRLLSTLLTRGVIAKNPQTGHYRLGLRLYELGTLAQSRVQLRQQALPLLEELRRVTGLTVLLCVSDGPDIVVIEQIGDCTVVAELGEGHRRYPAHAASAGIAIAAFNAEAAAVRRAAGFPPRATGTIRTQAEFDHALATARRRGVAVGAESLHEGICSIAAPLRDLNGVAHAALVVVGSPEHLFPVLERTSRLVTAIAARLSRPQRDQARRRTPTAMPRAVV